MSTRDYPSLYQLADSDVVSSYITSVNHLDHEMKVTYLNEKPEPRNPITLAIITDSETVYDHESVGDDIWGGDRYDE